MARKLYRNLSYVNKYEIVDTLRRMSDRAIQEYAWNNDEMFSSLMFDAQQLIETGLGSALNDGLLIFGEEIDTLFDPLVELSYVTDNDQFSIAEQLDLPGTQEVRRRAAELLPLVENASSAGSDVEFYAWVHVPYTDGTVPAQDNVKCDELPNGFFHIIQRNREVSDADYARFQFNIGDIVRCTKTHDNTIFKRTILTAIEKVGYEEVIP